jgi:hypothetical protein
VSFDPTANRIALAAQIKAILDASAQPANVQAHPQNDPALPAVLIIPRAGDDGLYVEFRGTYGPSSQCTQNLWVEIRVPGDSPSADIAMDQYLTPGRGECIWDAIEPRNAAGDVDHTLGITGVNCVAESGASPPTWYLDNETGTRTWLSSRIAVRITQQRGV